MCELGTTKEGDTFHRKWSTAMMVYIANRIPDVETAELFASVVSKVVIPKVEAQRGVVDTLNPTYVTSTFNCHIPCIMHETAACHAAMEIEAEFINQFPNIRFCIVIGSGYIMTGCCGAPTHVARVIIGETVDLITKIPSVVLQRLGSRIVLCEDTASKVGFEHAPVDILLPQWLWSLAVDDNTNTCEDYNYDYQRPVTLFELRSSLEECTPAKHMSLYNEAFSALKRGDYSKSIRRWNQYCKNNPDDLQAQRLLAICQSRLHLIQTHSASNLPVTTQSCADPYIRRDILWEGFEGEGRILESIHKHKRIESPLFTNTTDLFDSSGMCSGSYMSLGDTIREQLHSNHNYKYTEDGLISMFVLPDDDPLNLSGEATGEGEDGDHGTGLSNSNTSNALSVEFPITFEDSNKNKWQRSEDSIGTGAFSTVFIALGELGEMVAAKCFILSKHTTDEEELITEVNTLSSLRNDYVVGYVSYALTPNHLIILMEYVPGGSLYRLIRQFGHLNVSCSKRYLTSILRGVSYLHANSTTHCDIKPHNVLISNDGTCKLTDFGSSVTHQRCRSSRSDDLLTVRGTCWYMAPEAARGEVCPANDIWSIGITFIEVLTGSHPWEFNGGEKAFIIALGKVDTMKPTIPDIIQGDARQFIEQCLERNPDKRPSIQQLLNHPFLTCM